MVCPDHPHVVTLGSSHVSDLESSAEEQTLISRSHTEPSSCSDRTIPLRSLVRRKTTIPHEAPSNGKPGVPRPFSLRRATTTMLTPPRRIGPAPGFFESLKSILFASCAFSFFAAFVTEVWNPLLCHFFHAGLNVLLVFIPISVRCFARRISPNLFMEISVGTQFRTERFR